MAENRAKVEGVVDGAFERWVEHEVKQRMKQVKVELTSLRKFKKDYDQREIELQKREQAVKNSKEQLVKEYKTMREKVISELNKEIRQINKLKDTVRIGANFVKRNMEKLEKIRSGKIQDFVKLDVRYRSCYSNLPGDQEAINACQRHTSWKHLEKSEEVK